jgi:hypothetical protein
LDLAKCGWDISFLTLASVGLTACFVAFFFLAGIRDTGWEWFPSWLAARLKAVLGQKLPSRRIRNYLIL